MEEGLYIRPQMSKYFFIIARFATLIFVLATHVSAAQDINRDELLRELQTETNDSVRFNLKRDMGYSYEFTDTAQAMMYYRQNLAMANEKNNDLLKSLAHSDIGNVYFNSAAYEKCIAEHREAYRYAENAKNAVRMAVALFNIGNSYGNLNALDSAVNCNIAALKILEPLDEPARKSAACGNLSFYYSLLHQFKNSLDYGLRAIAYCKLTGSVDDLVANYMHVSACHMRSNSRELMVLYADSAAALCSQVTAPNTKTITYQNLASVYQQVSKLEKANAYADTALFFSDQLTNPSVAVSCFLVKGNILKDMGRLEEASVYYEKALPIALEQKEWQNLREIFLGKSEMEYARGDYHKAYDYLKEFVVYKDSTFNEEVAQQVLEMEAKYQNEKNEGELLQLSKEKEVETLKASQQSRLKFFFIGIAALALLAALLLFANFKRRNTINKQNEAIQLQKIKDLENEKQLVAMDGIIKGEENERSRVAKDLHDGLGSLLSGVKLSLSSMKGNVLISEEYANIFSSSLHQLDNAISEMRRVAHNMMPESLIKFGLVQATQNLCDGLNESGTLHVHLEHHNFTQRLANDQEITVYRMLQELVNNALKHASAKNIIIQLSRHDNNINIVVEDDGNGFDVSSLKSATGAGYANLQHRINYLKGTMDVKSDIGKGTSVLIEFPV